MCCLCVDRWVLNIYRERMNVDLTPDQRALVKRAIESGRFSHEEEAVQEALALWEERERRRAEILAALDEADAVLVVGSSLMAYSGYRFCERAHATGKPIAAINRGRTRGDRLFQLKVDADCAQGVVGLYRRLPRDLASGLTCVLPVC